MSKETSKIRLQVAKNYPELCKQVVQNILALSRNAIAAHGHFSILLSGGATPKGVYALMASPEYREQFQWHKIHFFWGDERWVSADDAKSNYRMATEAILMKADIPPQNIHPIRTLDGTLETAAAVYEKELASFFDLRNGECPRFDLILLGLGQDGHTASLFPGDPALSETNRLVAAVSQKEIDPAERITVTLPVINHAAVIFFLASGREKSQALKTALEGKGRQLPAQQVNPPNGEVWWFADQPAASLLRKGQGESS